MQRTPLPIDAYLKDPFDDLEAVLSVRVHMNERPGLSSVIPVGGAGWEAGRLGYPTSDQRKHGDVLSIEFEGGAIVVAPGQPVDLRQRRD